MNEMQALVASTTSLPLYHLTGSHGKAPADVSFEEERQPDQVASQLQQRRTFEQPASGIDLHSVVSMELLEAEEDDALELRGGDVVGRVAEMSKIVSDAQLYLQREGGDLGLKSNDSLLFIPRKSGEGEGSAADPLPSESEAESTPTNSPTHAAAHEGEGEEDPLQKLMCSSFGLHSPHLLMQQTETEDVEELLRQLQTSTNLPFEGDSLCLDPDIIDLTIIPPPAPDDVDFCCVTPDDNKTFLDQETGQRSEFYVARDQTRGMLDYFLL